MSAKRPRHGKSSTALCRVWYEIRKRCTNKNYKHFNHYGGRGITMCNEWWDSFQAFYDWSVSNGYKEGLTLDRIDVNGNYCPDNCRWVNRKVQANNTRSNHYITFNGETHTMSEWAEITGISYSTLRSRINLYKWDINKALTIPVKNRGEKICQIL